ncbi:hypothetical protein ACFL35_10760 [Candidatus Riflebacteria bacterium]
MKIINLNEYREKKRREKELERKIEYIEITLQGFNNKGKYTGKFEDELYFLITGPKRVEEVIKLMSCASKDKVANEESCPPNLIIDPAGVTITCLSPGQFSLNDKECSLKEIKTFFQRLFE